MDHTNCHVEIETKSVDHKTLIKSQHSRFLISGMGCQNCANRVQNALLRQDGVLEVSVDLDTHSAKVTYDAEKASVEALINAVRAAGNDGHHNYAAVSVE